MSPSTKVGRNLVTAVSVACVLALAVAGVLWWTLQSPNTKNIVAYFTGTVGLYEQNEVRIQGVPVGTVTDVRPQGDRVRVELEVERQYPVPANANAAIISPSLVSDRYVQLTPPYDGGERIAEGTVLKGDRTETPIEVDQVYASLNRLSKALGPDGANSQGQLSDLLNTLDRNMSGTGQKLNDTISQLGKASRTLSGTKEDLFSTVDNLQKFTGMLARSDDQLREFSQRLAGVNDFLARERGNLAASVRELGSALGSVKSFIQNNRGRLKSNVDKLSDVTQVLVDERSALAEVLDIAPTGLTNMFNTYDAASGTLHARDTFAQLASPPAYAVCTAVRQVTPDALPQTLADLCDGLAPVLDGAAPLPSLNQVIVALQQGKLPPVPLPFAKAYASPSAMQGGGQ